MSNEDYEIRIQTISETKYLYFKKNIDYDHLKMRIAKIYNSHYIFINLFSNGEGKGGQSLVCDPEKKKHLYVYIFR